MTTDAPQRGRTDAAQPPTRKQWAPRTGKPTGARRRQAKGQRQPQSRPTALGLVHKISGCELVPANGPRDADAVIRELKQAAQALEQLG